MYSAAPSAGTGKATAALVSGIVSIVACPSVVLSIGLGIAAIVLANQHAKSFGATGKSKGGKACGIAGIVLGVLWGVVWTLAISLGVWAFSTTSEIYDTPYDAPSASQDAGGSEAGDPEPDDDVIIAGGVDTASKYTFDVETAVVGLDEYSETPVVILMGEFTNDSDETVSFSGALSGSASQDGYSLDEAYLQGASAFNYESIAPGKTVPVFIGWELWDGESDVEILVRDQYHYAKEVVYEETFTIDELLANTKAFADELDGIIDDEKELTA